MEFKGGLKIFLLLKTPASRITFAERWQALGHSVWLHEGSGASALLPIHRFQPDLLVLESCHPTHAQRDLFSIQSEFPQLPCAYWDAAELEQEVELPPLDLPLVHPSFSDTTLESTARFCIQSQSQQHRLREANLDLELLLDGLGPAVILLSPQRIIQWLNDPAAELLQLPGAVALGRHVDEIVKLTTEHKETRLFQSLIETQASLLLGTHRSQEIAVEVKVHRLPERLGASASHALVMERSPWLNSKLESPALEPAPFSLKPEHWTTDLQGALLQFTPELSRFIAPNLARAQMQPVTLSQFVSEEAQELLQSHLLACNCVGHAKTPLQGADPQKQAFVLQSLHVGQQMIHWLAPNEVSLLDEHDRDKMEKLDSLGLLARGFAHDFNNLLTVLSGNLALGQQKLQSLGVAQQEWENAQTATQEAQSLVQQLLTFASGGTPIKKSLALHEFLQEFLSKHPRKANVDYFLNLSQSEVQVEFDPQQIRRVLSNLFKNSEQALGTSEGMITLSCRLKSTDGAQAKHGAPMEVEIQVRDTGEGIDAARLAQVFQPYYSTRQAMNATGLGLTVCESIVKAHGGQVKIVSYLGHETVVTVTLPANPLKPAPPVSSSVVFTSPKAAVELPSLPPSPLGLAAGVPAVKTSPRILLLDDEKGIRNVVRMTLAPKGYDLTETEDGLDTLRAYQKALVDQNPFDLVILDLSIPLGMGGLQAMESLKDMDPSVKAIVSSGYSDDPVMSNPQKYGFTDVLPKPYLPKDLLNMVQKHLS